MRLAHHLAFAGDCEEAFGLYSKVLGGANLAIRRYADTPLSSQMPPDWQQKVIFANLMIGNTALHGTDHPPDQYRRP